MGKIAVTQLTSLDGVMQSPGTTDVPFKYRGWIFDFDAGPDGDRLKLEEAQNSEALLFGRVVERDRPGRRQARGSGQAAEGAGRRDRRLRQPPPLAGTRTEPRRSSAAATMSASRALGRRPAVRCEPLEAPRRLAPVRRRERLEHRAGGINWFHPLRRQAGADRRARHDAAAHPESGGAPVERVAVRATEPDVQGGGVRHAPQRTPLGRAVSAAAVASMSRN
jgi:hypothetical protein